MQSNGSLSLLDDAGLSASTHRTQVWWRQPSETLALISRETKSGGRSVESHGGVATCNCESRLAAIGRQPMLVDDRDASCFI